MNLFIPSLPIEMSQADAFYDTSFFFTETSCLYHPAEPGLHGFLILCGLSEGESRSSTEMPAYPSPFSGHTASVGQRGKQRLLNKRLRGKYRGRTESLNKIKEQETERKRKLSCHAFTLYTSVDG